MHQIKNACSKFICVWEMRNQGVIDVYILLFLIAYRFC